MEGLPGSFLVPPPALRLAQRVHSAPRPGQLPWMDNYGHNERLAGPGSAWNMTVDVDARNQPERVIFCRRDVDSVDDSERHLVMRGDSDDGLINKDMASQLDQADYMDHVPCDVSFHIPNQPPLSKQAHLTENDDGLHIDIDDVPPSLLSSIQSSMTDFTSDDNHSDTPQTLSSPIIIKHPHRSVRFRSRVRITSGLRRHVHRSRSDLSLSPSSELSSSPSSSISAPLRTPADEQSSPWGPFGQRVKIMSHRPRRPSGYQHQHQITDRTPLMYQTTPKTPLYGDADDELFYEEIDAEARLNHEIDAAFGPFPARLLNRHWWWWQIEPVLCCICMELDESDSEDG